MEPISAPVMSCIEDIDCLLYTFKALKEKHGILFYQREKNIQALLTLGVSAQQREAIVMGLEPRDYYRGPREDVLVSGAEFWEFGKMVRNYMVYIKLSIGVNGSPVCCFSFHPAEREMVFPYK